jgi:mono/diheme cytochrome c family protein
MMRAFATTILRAALSVALSVALLGCDQNMTSQPKYAEYEPAPLFPNGQVLQAPVPGTVARDDLARAQAAANKPALTPQLLARGHERFDIFCAQCHGRVGAGGGMVVMRGFPRPPSFHGDRLRQASDQHFFDVITNGYGVMYAHASRVPPRDRWAIIAYIRALQLSQHATLDDVPLPERARLAGAQP